MSKFIYGVYPQTPDGPGAGAPAVDPYDFATAKQEIDWGDVYTVQAGYEYIVSSLTITGTLLLTGSLTLLGDAGVMGPAGSVDTSLVLWDGVTGRQVSDSAIVVTSVPGVGAVLSSPAGDAQLALADGTGAYLDAWAGAARVTGDTGVQVNSGTGNVDINVSAQGEISFTGEMVPDTADVPLGLAVPAGTTFVTADTTGGPGAIDLGLLADSRGMKFIRNTGANALTVNAGAGDTILAIAGGAPAASIVVPAWGSAILNHSPTAATVWIQYI